MKGMICDRAKVVSLREANFLSQEKLAALARVDRRTIQRLEAGEPVSIETLNQVAAPLKVTAYDLLLDPEESADDPDGSAGILLKPERSGLRIVDAICTSDRIDIGAAFEPWPEQIEFVAPLLRTLGELHPHTFENVADYDTSLRNPPSRLIIAAKVNASLPKLLELRPEGLHILFGQ
jgi:transcriptional regulator with XRE-family HTH domain